MRNRFLYFILGIIALFDFQTLCAQKISVKSVDGDKLVKSGNIYYTVAGNSFSFVVAVDSVPAFSSFSYNVKRDGTTIVESEISSDNELISDDGTFNVVVSSTYNTGSFVLTVIGRLKDSDDEVGLSGTDNTVIVCSSLGAPIYTGDWSNGNLTMNIWDDRENNLGVSMNGVDNHCTIKYSWYVGENLIGVTSSNWRGKLTVDDNNYSQGRTIYARYEYIAPDKSTVWSYGETQHITYTVWKSPEESDFNFYYAINEIKQSNKSLYIFDGYNNSIYGNRTLNVAVGLKPDGWTIKWKKDGIDLTNTSMIYTPQAESSSRTVVYSVDASYRPSSNLTAKSLTSKQINAVTVSAPEVEISDGQSDGSRYVVWNTTQNRIPIKYYNYTGGNDASWETKLETSGSSISRTFQTVNGTCTVDVGQLANSSGTSKTDYDCTVTIYNKDPNGDTWYQYEYKRKYEVWRYPESDDVIKVYSVVGKNKREGTPMYLYPGYDDDEYGSRYFLAETFEDATLSSLWTYKWTDKDGNTKSSQDSFKPQFNDNLSAGKVNDVYTFSAEYKPIGLIESEQPYRFTKEVTVETWPAPSIELKNELWKNGGYIDIWDNTTLTLSVNTNGGYNNGWEYEWSGAKSTVLEKGFRYTVGGPHSEYFLATNSDPNGEEWFRQRADVTITSYVYPDPELDSEFKTYLNYEKEMVVSTYDFDDKYSWYKNGSELVSTSNSCMPSANKNIIQGHDRDTVNYRFLLRNKKENMPDSIVFEKELWAKVIFWPEPKATLQYNSSDLYDGQTLSMSIDYTECIDGDGSNWKFSWFRENKKVSELQSYSDLAENTTNDYTTVNYSVVVSNLLDYGYTDKTYIDTIPFELRVKPLLSVKDTLEFIPTGDTDPRYNYAGSFDKDNFVWNILKGCDVKYYIDLAPSMKIKSLTISLLDNSGDAVDIASYDKSDNFVLFPSSSYGMVGDYSLHIEGELEYTEYSELGVSRKINFTQAPKVRVSDLPSASPLWEKDKWYVVWTDSIIKSGINRIEPSQIDGIWKYEWSKSEESSPELLYPFSYDGTNRWLDTINVKVYCYAPDGNTLWYSDCFSRYFEVWKVPALKCISEEWLSVGSDSLVFITKNNLDVCSKYEDIIKIALRVKDDGNENLKWTYSWSKLSENEWTKVDSESDSVAYLLKDSNDYKDSILYRIKTVVTPTVGNMNQEFINKPIERQYYFKTRIWPVHYIEDVTTYYEDYLMVQAPDLIPNMKLNRIGGLDDKYWSMVWKNDMNESVGTDKVNIKAVNNTTTSILNKYTADIHVWGPDGLDWYRGDPISYNVKVYPDIQDIYVSIAGIDDNDNGYTALYSEDTLIVTLAHDYTFEGGEWAYRSSLEGDTTLKLLDGKDVKEYIDLTTQVLTDTIDGNAVMINGDSLTFSIEVQCVTMENVRLRDIKIDRELMIWPRASITVPQEYSFDNISHHVYQDDVIKLKPDYIGPDSVGWKYIWTDLDKDSDLDTEQKLKSTYRYTAQKKPDEPKEICYDLKGVYQRDGARQLVYDSLKFAWKEYRQAVSPQKPGGEPIQIRENDFYTYMVTDYKYGNPDGWVFDWKEDGKIINDVHTSENNIQYTIIDNTKEGMHREKKTYTVEYKNVSPDGKIWLEGTIAFDDVTVYRRPQEPVIMLKGNGTSNIYVATEIPLNFENLEYRFVFGDGDIYENVNAKWSNDKDIIEVPFQYYGNNKPSKPYVRTLWVYGDGYYCYSEASTIINTPSTKGMIGELIIDNNGFCAEFPEPVTAQVDVCSMTGDLVRSFNFGSKTTFNETINLNGMDSGIYIIRYRVGDLNEVRKIVLR